MDTKTILWYGVLGSVTAAYLVAMAGVRSAKHGDVPRHSHRMITACLIVGIWLVAYVSKQALFGRERFGGPEADYWRFYVPLFSVHMLMAVTTIGLGAYNLYIGLTKLRQGTGVGAMAAGVSRHRRMGKILVWSFSGTMATAYMVYLMLFVWYQA